MALTRIQAMTAQSEVDNYTDDEGMKLLALIVLLQRGKYTADTNHIRQKNG